MTETIALFGATGNTGKHFLKLALQGGYKVQAMARSPSKVETKDEKLTLVEGDFSKEDAIEQTVKGATYVVSLTGGPMGKPTEYPKDLLLNFFKTLTRIIQNKAPSVKVLLHQAGFLCSLPDKPNSWLQVVARSTLASRLFLGLEPHIQDHEEVIKYIYDQKEKGQDFGFQIIVTRPALLREKEGGKVNLVADHGKGAMSPVTFYDLAAWSLKAIKNESLYGTFPYVDFAR